MTKLEKLAKVLADGQWHSTGELVEVVGHRFSATLHIATHKGDYRVEKRRADDRQFEYRKIISLDSGH